MIKKELSSQYRYEFESKQCDITEHGYTGKFPDLYELKNLTGYRFVPVLDKSKYVPILE